MDEAKCIIIASRTAPGKGLSLLNAETPADSEERRQTELK